MIKSIIINGVILVIALFGVYIGYTKFIDYRQEERDKIILDAKLDLLNNQSEVNTTVNAGTSVINNTPQEIAIQETNETVPEIVLVEEAEVVIEKKEIPATFDQVVQFHPQSPLGMWGPIFEETCEEASALIAVNHFRNIKMDAATFRNELLDIVEWQKERFGKYDHTNVDETGQILKEYFGYENFLILNDPTSEQMKGYLAQGNLIIAPFYGVGMNPYYSDGGPPYHFIAIKGYTENTFITHDVGTKRGENYEYPISDIMDRLHDYDATDIQLGAKKLIVVQKN